MTHDPSFGPERYVLCIGMPLEQVGQVAQLLRGAAVVVATADTEGARMLLGPLGSGPGPVRSAPPPGRHLAHDAGEFARPSHALAGPQGAAPMTPPAGIPVPLTPGAGTGVAPVSGPIPVVAPVTGALPVVAPVTAELPAVTPATSGFGVVSTFGAPKLVRGPLHMDLATREASARGELIHLSMREFDLLAALASDIDRVWSFAELTLHVWRTGYLGDPDPVVSAVKRLRKRLYGVPELEVASVRGVGYRLLVPA
jgi:Transcriptional regulatory protein, C terminal